jgi:hypothetical protein
MWITDGWLNVAELLKIFGLSEDSIKRMAKNQRLPLRRLTPDGTPGVLESEFLRWFKRIR